MIGQKIWEMVHLSYQAHASPVDPDTIISYHYYNHAMRKPALLISDAIIHALPVVYNVLLRNFVYIRNA